MELKKDVRLISEAKDGKRAQLVYKGRTYHCIKKGTEGVAKGGVVLCSV